MDLYRNGDDRGVRNYSWFILKEVPALRRIDEIKFINVITRLLYIARLITAVLFPLLFLLVFASAQTVVYQNTTTTLSVVDKPGDTYEWELYSDLAVNFATVPGNCPAAAADFANGNTGTGVLVRWLRPGIYFYKVTARNSAMCTMNFKIGMFKVIPREIEAVITGDTLMGVCQTIALNGTASVGEIIKYEWSAIDPGGTVTNLSGSKTDFLLNSSFAGPLPGNFRIKLTVTDQYGNLDSDTTVIKVDSRPEALISTATLPEKDGTMIVDGSGSSGRSLHYRWYTTEGNIVGPADQPTVKLFGAGNYSLEITDHYGCTSTKNFKFPIELYNITANPDYAKMTISADTTINVLANDESIIDLLPGTVRITKSPVNGVTRVNADGSITYRPRESFTGRDRFDYEVCNALDLCASATVTIDIDDISIIIPGAFSPNGDGLNEHLEFGRLEKYPLSQLYIYTRAGQLVYENKDYRNDWNGTTFNGSMTVQQPLPTGTYYYVLKPGGTDRTIKGFIYIGY